MAKSLQKTVLFLPEVLLCIELGRNKVTRTLMADVQRQMLQFHETIKLKRFDENEILREKRDLLQAAALTLLSFANAIANRHPSQAELSHSRRKSLWRPVKLEVKLNCCS